MEEDEFRKPPTDFAAVHLGGGYSSAFESESEAEGPASAAIKKDPLFKAYSKPRAPKATNEVFREEASKEAGRARRCHFLALDAYSRHKKLVNQYLLYHPGATAFLKRDTSRDKTDLDILQQHHRFLWEEEDEADTWEKRLAKKYYDRLFKEYCITDLSRYKENKIALRWRTEQEVVDGRGQFSCGNKRCQKTEGLRSWEVNFGYVEQGEKKNALVKLRLCPPCSDKLNHRHQRREVTRKKKKMKRSLSPDNSTQPDKKLRPDSPAAAAGDGEDNKEGESVWRQSAAAQQETDKSQEEEFEDYLADMLL